MSVLPNVTDGIGGVHIFARDLRLPRRTSPDIVLMKVNAS